MGKEPLRGGPQERLPHQTELFQSAGNMKSRGNALLRLIIEVLICETANPRDC